MKFRPRRVGDEIRAVVCELLERKLSDPRLAGVRISEVRVSPDLKRATLFFSLYPGDDSGRAAAATALDRAAGLIRRELGRRLRAKVTPALQFEPDLAPAHADHIERVLAAIGPIPPPADGDDE